MRQEDPAILAELSALAQSLAGYLREADHVDRLLSLFRDDRRVARRFDPEVGNWDAYQQDLEAAWDALDGRLAAPEGDVTDPVPDLLRLALVRGTLSSADDLPPALVAAAIRTGTWTVERAASTIGRHPSPDHRALMLCELLRTLRLDDDLRRTIASQLIELAHLPSPDLPAEALLSGLDLLEPAERLTVTDRITADAVVLSVGVRASPITGPQVSPETAVHAIETVPEARRPAFLTKVADSLLRSLAQSRTARPEPVSGIWQSLLEFQYQDSVEAAFDPQRARVQAAALLARLARFLPALPAAQQLVDRVAAVVSHVPDEAGRDTLVAAFRDAFPDRDIAWSTAGGEPENGATDDQVGYRRRLMGQIHELLGMGGHAGETDNGDFLSPSLDELNARWLAAAMPPPPEETPPPSEEELREAAAAEVDTEKSHARVIAELQRVGGPVFAGVIAAMQGLPDEILYQVVRATADPWDLGGQLFIASFATEALDEAVRIPVVRKVKAGLLIAALDRHFREVGLRAAWRGAEPELLADVEWDAVLTFVLTLPAEEQRNALYQLHGPQDAANIDQIPRLAALRLLLPQLSIEQVGVAFADLISLSDPRVRRLALELVAPRLNAAQVAQALRALGGGGDVREQGWFLIELSRRLGSADLRLPQIMQWSLDAVTAMRTGRDFGLVSSIPVPRHAAPASDDDLTPAEGLPMDRVLATLQGMDDNNRTDALLAIASTTSGQLPVTVVEEALRLPVLNTVERYSPRGQVIAILAHRFPEEMLPAAFTAAMQLPHRIGIGDAQAWGWSWTYEYPRGSALYGLAPRLIGELAEAAFTASRDLPWMAREEVLQRLAPRADGPLAAAMFDYSFDIHDKYMSLPDSARVPYVLEETLVTEPIHVFKIYREVHLAEIIAATAARLDPARLQRAVTQAQSFDNAGPRAWLPARLLPLLGEDRREPLLSSAVVAVMEFITDDPSRLNLVTDLLPYMRTEISRRREPLNRFLEQRFPGRHDLLTGEELQRLPEDEQQEYWNLVAASRFSEVQALADDGGDDARRAMLITVVLSPLFAENIQQVLTSALTAAPLEARVDALESMKQILEPGSHASVVAATLRQVVEAEMEPMDRVRRLIALLPHLDQPARDSLVAEASRLPGPPAEEEEGLRSEFVELALKDFGKPSKRNPRFDKFRHNVMALVVRRTMSDDDSDVIRRRRGPRVQLLNALGPTLSKAGVAGAIELVRTLPDDVERADGIAALLPVATGESRRLLRAALAELASPFARWWALINSQEALRAGEDDDPALAGFARSTAEDFLEPREVAVFLLLLIGYARSNRQEWIKRAAALSESLPVHDRLRVLAIITRMATEDPDLARTAVGHVCALPTPASVYDGWVMATRLGVDRSALTDIQLSQLRLAASMHLRAAARRGRAELLRTLAGESTAIAGLTTADGIVDMARAVRDICIEWRWPSEHARPLTR